MGTVIVCRWVASLVFHIVLSYVDEFNFFIGDLYCLCLARLRKYGSLLINYKKVDITVDTFV